MKERETALDILMNIEEKGSYSNLELNKQLAGLESREKGFITNIIYGVLQNRLRLDYIIQAYSKLPMKKISADILNILRIGVYQIEFLDKVPDYAIVNESIKLVKKCKKTSACGFVNAVLRGVIRKDKNISYPKDFLTFLSVYYSYPLWICEMWYEIYGKETEELLKAGNTPPPFTVRVNTLKTSVEEFISKTGGERTKLCDSGVILPGGIDVAQDSLYKEGLYYPQDEASMLPAVILYPKPGETVIDMCAAPGGKTSHMAQLMQNSGKILAFDIYEHKINLIEKTAARLGIDIITAQIQDASILNESYIESADKVLVDAPCSGLGILRRKPEIKLNKTPDDIKALSDLQRQILNTASKYLKAGGELVYSTCTISPKENESNIELFLSEHTDFEPVCINGGKHYIQLLPQQFNTDGFFITKLRKKEVII